VSAVNSVLKPYLQLVRLDRPIGILLLLWPTLTALWVAAEGVPDLTVLIVFVLGVAIMRSAGCAINDFADREIDGKVTRTKQRPLATGVLKPKQAVAVFVGLALVGFVLVLQLNTITIWMSVIGVGLAASYPFMKRYTYLPQVYLGIAFGWAIPMAFTAQQEAVPIVGWLLFLGNIIWTTMYDTFYAMADRPDDIKAGVKSTAILFGDDDLVIQGILQAAFLLVMVTVGQQIEAGLSFYLALLGVAGLFVYQQVSCQKREPKACFEAFLNNNWVGALVFISIVLHYI
jgi:4-hydroxybenzoate polyprenyltransferase